MLTYLDTKAKPWISSLGEKLEIRHSLFGSQISPQTDFSGRSYTHIELYHFQAGNNDESFKHVITGAKSSEVVDTPGGIIADDMGLGKTLSMLAAVVASAPQAVEHAFISTRAPTLHWQDITPSKSTLVVVPSACKLPVSVALPVQR